MKIIEVGTGYTSIPAKMGAATEIVVEELGKALKEQNINYEIFDIKDEKRLKTTLKIKEVDVPNFFRKKDVSLGIMHKLKRVIYSISLARVLRKEIINSNEDLVIHFHNQYNMFFFYKLVSKKIRKKVKLVYTVHSYIWNGEWKSIEKTIRKRYFQEIFCIRNADKVFVLNDITKEHFINNIGVDSNRIIKIDNGVNTEIYKPKYEKNNGMIFFQSGSVCERKNQLEAITLLTPYFKKNKTVKYVYAGGIIDQNYKNKIDEYIKENELQNQIEYLGEVSPGIDLSKFYNQAKAFIFPSTAEAFSLVILEAMACGLPVIMNGKVILETDNNLDEAILFYQDKNSFENIINEKILNEDNRKIIAEKSRKLIEDRYGWKSVAMKYLENI